MEEGTSSTLFKSDGCDERYPYRNLVGALMYLYQGTRPDMSFAINTLSRFNTSYKQEHWNAAKRVLKYLKGSTDYKIKYGPTFKDIVGYSDASFPKAPIDDPKSVSGNVFMFCGEPISWTTHRPSTYAVSSTEAEYTALLATTRESVCYRHLREKLFIREDKPITLNCDNKITLHLALKGNFSKESCHTYHNSIKQYVAEKHIVLNYCRTDDMIADGLTKALKKIKFKRFIESFNLCHRPECKVESVSQS